MGERVRTDGSGLHCPHCGKEATTEHSYCIHCGGDLSDLHAVAETDHDVSKPTQGHTDARDRPKTRDKRNTRDREADAMQFRKRVQYLLSRGWDIKYDAGDEVILVDRGIGSIWVHILLLIFTGGMGNLLYAWYHYSIAPQRVMLRADGPKYEVVHPSEGRTDARVYEKTASSLGQFAFGLLFLLIGIGTIITTGLQPIPLLFGGLVAFLSLFMMPPTRRRIRDRHPPTTFGPTESVEERYVNNTDRPCTVCGTRVEDGVVRDYKRERVLAGIPLYTMEDGENYYCSECKNTADRGTSDFHGSTHQHPTSSETFDEGFDEIDRELERLREHSGGSLADREDGPDRERPDQSEADRKDSDERAIE